LPNLIIIKINGCNIIKLLSPHVHLSKHFDQLILWPIPSFVNSITFPLDYNKKIIKGYFNSGQILYTNNNEIHIC
jgi:hypothetical protein